MSVTPSAKIVVLVGVVSVRRYPVTNVPTSAPGCRDAAQAADDAAGAVQVVELELHDHRCHRAQHDRGQEEPGEGEEQGRAAPALTRRRAQRADDRHDEQRQEAAQAHRGPDEQPRVEPVGQLAAEPGARGDRGEHRPDDRRVGLEADADVRGEEPSGEDLEHEHRGRAHEDERRGNELRHQRSLAPSRALAVSNIRSIRWGDEQPGARRNRVNMPGPACVRSRRERSRSSRRAIGDCRSRGRSVRCSRRVGCSGAAPSRSTGGRARAPRRLR